MTINPSERIKRFPQEKKVIVFDGKNGVWNAAADQHHVVEHGESNEQMVQNIEVEEQSLCVSEDKQQAIKPVNEKMTTDGSLLILAQYAEIMLESEVNQTSRNDQTKPLENDSYATVSGTRSAGKQINGIPRINGEDEFHRKGRGPRLIHIRRQARSKGNLLVQQRAGECTTRHSQGERIRLTQIRRQARRNSQSQLQDNIRKYLCGNSEHRTIRLSQVRRLARSKGSLPMQDTIKDQIPSNPDFQISEDNQKARIIQEIFGPEDCFQVADGDAEDEMIFTEGRMCSSQLGREATTGNAEI